MCDFYFAKCITGSAGGVKVSIPCNVYTFADRCGATSYDISQYPSIITPFFILFDFALNYWAT